MNNGKYENYFRYENLIIHVPAKILTILNCNFLLWNKNQINFVRFLDKYLRSKHFDVIKKIDQDQRGLNQQRMTFLQQ